MSMSLETSGAFARIGLGLWLAVSRTLFAIHPSSPRSILLYSILPVSVGNGTTINTRYVLMQGRRDVRHYNDLQTNVWGECEDKAHRFMGGDAGTFAAGCS